MIVAYIALVTSSFVTSPAPVTVGSLLAEMTDLDRIARMPEPKYKLLQASSYDRAQTDPAQLSTWFANADSGQFIRTEQRDGHTEWVMMDHVGPGAITRFWIPLLAEKDQAIIRFYFDGSDRPGIETNFNELMRGKGFVKPPFAFIAWPDKGVEAGVAGDLYFPIPYAKSCKVTLNEVPFYYAIGYRAYGPGTPVETFSQSHFAAVQPQIAATARKLASFSVRPLSYAQTVSRTLKPSASLNFKVPVGPSAVDSFAVKLPAGSGTQALRSVVVEATFDGERTVWCPIGDFFGAGTSGGTVSDRYRRVEADGTMTCFWRMPYRKSATIRLLNLGTVPVTLQASVSSAPWTWDERSMHFHANWRRQYPLATRPMSDWNFIEANGQGVYVGDTLTVMSPAPAWYGEGDERVYVDGEKFPSQLGTGTEDYYGYAWGMSEHFSSPFIAMPQRSHKGREDWTGFTTTSRVRLLDGIPFTHSLKMDMEVWHWADCRVEYAVATFWYARPGATSNRPPTPSDAAQPLREWQTLVKGAVECESMEIVNKSEGIAVAPQGAGLTEGTWSNGQQLFVQSKSVGDFVELRFPGKGRARMTLYTTKSYDYGIIRLSVNGKRVKDVDLWSAQPKASGTIDLGVLDLGKGPVILRAEVIGTHPQSRGSRYYFGLDCVTMAAIR